MKRELHGAIGPSPHIRGAVLGVLFFAGSVSGAAADSPIRFLGVTVIAKTTSVRLSDESSGVSDWVEVGKPFEDYTVSAYDAKEEQVSLAKGGAIIRVRLNVSKVGQRDPEEVEKLREAVLQNLKDLWGATRQYYLQTGQSHTTVREIIEQGGILKEEPKAVDGENYDSLDLSLGNAPRITTASGIVVVIE